MCEQQVMQKEFDRLMDYHVHAPWPHHLTEDEVFHALNAFCLAQGDDPT